MLPRLKIFCDSCAFEERLIHHLQVCRELSDCVLAPPINTCVELDNFRERGVAPVSQNVVCELCRVMHSMCREEIHPVAKAEFEVHALADKNVLRNQE